MTTAGRFSGRALGLLPIPLVVLLATLLALRDRGPFWLGTNSDPSYTYVLNTLRLLEGAPPTHLDHPGLTTHLFGAAAFASTHRLASRRASVTEDVLAHPEWYLRHAVRAWLVLFAAALVGLGLAVHRAAGAGSSPGWPRPVRSAAHRHGSGPRRRLGSRPS